MNSQFHIVVFISGTGSNLESIINKQSLYDYKVSSVVSNNIHAKGLNIAKQHQIPIFTFKWDTHDNDLTAVQSHLNKHPCQLVVLAGFMKILPIGFLNVFNNKIINIHPSLLPKYPGLHTHQRVLDNKDAFHGATVHYVNAELDAGKIISQTKIKVEEADDAEALAERLLFREHSLLPRTIALIRQNRVKWHNKTLFFDQKILTTPIMIND